MKLAATLLVLAALAALAPAAMAATPQAAAMQRVCFARSDISNEIGQLRADVVAPGTPADVRLSLKTIVGDLSTIRSALPGASPAFRRQAAVATLAFSSGFARLVPAILAAPGGPAPPARVALFTAATTQLQAGYAKTLGLITCA